MLQRAATRSQWPRQTGTKKPFATYIFILSLPILTCLLYTLRSVHSIPYFLFLFLAVRTGKHEYPQCEFNHFILSYPILSYLHTQREEKHFSLSIQHITSNNPTPNLLPPLPRCVWLRPLLGYQQERERVRERGREKVVVGGWW